MRTNDLHKHISADAVDKLCDLYASVQESSQLLTILIEGEYWEAAAKTYPQHQQQVNEFGVLLNTIRDGADKLALEAAQPPPVLVPPAPEPQPPTEVIVGEDSAPPGGLPAAG